MSSVFSKKRLQMFEEKRIMNFKYNGKVVRSMKQYEVLLDQELFPGSDVVRGFAYKAAASGDNYALFWETDCFVRCSPFDGIIGRTTDL